MKCRGGTQGGDRPLCFVRHTATRRLIEEFSDEPQVAERVKDGTLEHSADGLRALGFVSVLFYWALVRCPGSEGLAVDGDRVIDEGFDWYGGEAGGGWSTGALSRGFFGEEELGAIDAEGCDGAIQVLRYCCAECGFVEVDGGFGIGDS